MMVLAALLATTGTIDPAPLEIVLRGPAPACTFAIDGRIVTGEELKEAVRRTAVRQPRVIIRIADVSPDYRCIGAAVYTVQSASPVGTATNVEVVVSPPPAKP